MERAELLKIAMPILFNTEMVQAVLEGRKTQTRRVVKPQPMNCTCYDCEKRDEIYFNASSGYIRCRNCNSAIYNGRGKFCFAPYNLGDILYVRETWSEGLGSAKYLYLADYSSRIYAKSCLGQWHKWHPSIHMPKEAARIFLRVTNVHVERLQDISVESLISEGVKEYYCGMGESGYAINAHSSSFYDSPIGAYIVLWDSTIPKKDLDKYGWDANPWVWVVEFERLEVEG